MTDTKEKYTKQELIYTSHLHTDTVLDHCILAADLVLLSTQTLILSKDNTNKQFTCYIYFDKIAFYKV